MRVLKYFAENLNYAKINVIEEKLYSNQSDEDRRYIIYARFVQILEKIINESIKKDIILRARDFTPWVCINLDSLYSQNCLYDIDLELVKNILPRTKNPDVAIKIISNNILISTLSRCQYITLYNRQIKKHYPSIISDKINFTKGYLVCIDPLLVKECLKLIYRRKLYCRKPINITSTAKTLRDALSNKYFSNPIWLKEIYIKTCNTPDTPFDVTKLTEIINILNSQKLSYNMNLFNMIYNHADKNTNPSLMSKNRLIEYIYKIEQSAENTYIEISDNDRLQLNISSTSILELIKHQYERITKYNNGFFYLNYKLDNRTRIYVYNYPLNYQLMHVVRLTMKLVDDVDFKIIYDKFKNHPLIKPFISYIINHTLLQKKINIDAFLFNNSVLIDDITDGWSIKKECWIHILSKLSPKKIITLDKKIEYAQIHFSNFVKSNLLIEYEKWLDLFKIKYEKLIYLYYYQNIIKNMLNNIYDDTVWLDASSNAIQLITLRMGFHNKNLLKLTNIIDNDTKYINIYNYVTQQINNMSHKTILKKINNTITVEEFLSLQNDDDNKKRIMPASYGMTRYENREKMNKILSCDDRSFIWNKLNTHEHNIISDYLWAQTFKILKKIGYDLKKYMKICKNNKQCLWLSDYGLPILNIQYKTSKRSKILHKIQQYEYKIKNNITDTNNTLYTLKLKRLKTKLKNDENTFWKRTKIRVNNDIYTTRINVEPHINDTRKEIQSQAPNSIHCYDASIIFLAVKICNELNIPVLTIHDSLGCKNIHLSFVKTIFKISNIYFLEQSSKKAPYPFKQPINVNKDLYYEILKSENFFR